ncbi:MAG: hypothetical protein ACI841_001432 [Planctomycetota bacterium]|jgi:hypothetical protein
MQKPDFRGQGELCVSQRKPTHGCAERDIALRNGISREAYAVD